VEVVEGGAVAVVVPAHAPVVVLPVRVPVLRVNAPAMVLPVRRPAVITRPIGTPFPPDHDEVAASHKTSRGGPGCFCAVCGEQGRRAARGGLSGWANSMHRQLQSAITGAEECTGGDTDLEAEVASLTEEHDAVLAEAGL
jgi:hypothetical protein